MLAGRVTRPLLELIAMVSPPAGAWPVSCTSNITASGDSPEAGMETLASPGLIVTGCVRVVPPRVAETVDWYRPGSYACGVSATLAVLAPLLAWTVAGTGRSLSVEARETSSLAAAAQLKVTVSIGWSPA